MPAAAAVSSVADAAEGLTTVPLPLLLSPACPAVAPLNTVRAYTPFLGPLGALLPGGHYGSMPQDEAVALRVLPRMLQVAVTRQLVLWSPGTMSHEVEWAQPRGLACLHNPLALLEGKSRKR